MAAKARAAEEELSARVATLEREIVALRAGAAPAAAKPRRARKRGESEPTENA
jgi:cell division protein FtsB